VQGGGLALEPQVFTQLVWISLIPAVLGVLCLALGARETPGRATGEAAAPPPALRGLGRPFSVFLVIVGIFELGNSADAFLVLRAQERGLSVLEILCVLLAFNAVYALLSAPAGRLSDRVGRRPVLVAGWLLYAAVYLGFAVAEAPWHTALYAFYGAHYGLSYGTAKALVADLVPAERRGAAYGAYSATVGILDLPASLLAGVLWQGVGGWAGFGPAAPFWLGAGLAGAAALALALWRPPAAEPAARGSDDAVEGRLHS
jgi:MFS family permease